MPSKLMMANVMVGPHSENVNEDKGNKELDVRHGTDCSRALK